MGQENKIKFSIPKPLNIIVILNTNLVHVCIENASIRDEVWYQDLSNREGDKRYNKGQQSEAPKYGQAKWDKKGYGAMVNWEQDKKNYTPPSHRLSLCIFH